MKFVETIYVHFQAFYLIDILLLCQALVERPAERPIPLDSHADVSAGGAFIAQQLIKAVKQVGKPRRQLTRLQAHVGITWNKT